MKEQLVLTNKDEFINNASKWQEELAKLREIVLNCALIEEFKWHQPCYTYQNSNIVIISGFKDYCALNFFKGSLLKDPNNILIAPGENTQSGRQIRFTNIEEIIEMESILKSYIFEAVEVERAGLKVDFKRTSEYIIPEELKNKFNADYNFKTAFNALTPGRQKAYILYFSATKQSQTRKSRIEKYSERIMNGQGINDCVCGHSKRYPICDGSHKYIKPNHWWHKLDSCKFHC